MEHLIRHGKIFFQTLLYKKMSSYNKGSLLIIYVISLILLNFSIHGLLTRANIRIKANKEKELKHILLEYKNAIRRFAQCHNRMPLNFNEMLLDSNGRKFLRRVYKDPFTNSFKWNFIYNHDKTELSIKSFTDEISLSGKRYSEW